MFEDLLSPVVGGDLVAGDVAGEEPAQLMSTPIGAGCVPAASSSFSRALADATSEHDDAGVTATVRTGSSVSGSVLAANVWLRGSSSWARAGYDMADGYNLAWNFVRGHRKIPFAARWSPSAFF